MINGRQTTSYKYAPGRPLRRAKGSRGGTRHLSLGLPVLAVTSSGIPKSDRWRFRTMFAMAPKPKSSRAEVET
jgi:hypothetical protein